MSFISPRLAIVLSCLAVGGCGTTSEQLSQTEVNARWQFTSNLDQTAQCFASALNREWEPKTSAEQFWGRSIRHDSLIVEPGKTIHIVHEHIGPSTGWMVVVRAASPGSVAEGHYVSFPTAGEKMERAALSCGGKKF